MTFGYQRADAHPLSAVQKSLVLVALVVLLSLLVDLEIPYHIIGDSTYPVMHDSRFLEVQDDGNDPKSVVDLTSDTSVLTYKECIQHMESNRLPALIAKLTQDPEVNGVIPHDLSNTGTTVDHMKGLDLNVFRGKRIALMGDSTLYYPAKWLYALLTELENEGVDDPKYEEMALSEAQSLVLQRSEELGFELLDRSVYPPPIKTSDGTWIEWMGIAGGNSPELKNITDEMFVTAEQMDPDIVVANMGLHWVHMCPFTQCPARHEFALGALMINDWVNYKRDWLQRVYDMAVKTNVKLLLFKTTNFICDEKRTHAWASWSSRYLSFDPKTIENCYQANIKFVDSENISKDQIYNYCKYGQMTEVGSKYMNDQIEDFVKEKHETQSDSTLTVGIFNGHDVEGCQDTEDGMHHTGNMLVRLRLLSNTIESYSECAMK